jgi:hypothetical protein
MRRRPKTDVAPRELKHIIPTLIRAGGVFSTGFPESPGKPNDRFERARVSVTVGEKNESAKEALLLVASGALTLLAQQQARTPGVAHSACSGSRGDPLAHRHSKRNMWVFFKSKRNIFYL